MRLSWPLAIALLSRHVIASNQQPIEDWSKQIGKDELIQILTDSLIIPSIIDDFLPTVKLELSWKNASTQYGNEIDPDDLQKQPAISLQDWRYSSAIDTASKKKHKDKEPEFVVVLTDPDAPSFDNPKWSQVCHWIAADLPVAKEKADALSHKAKSIVEYKPPGPPPKTGRHRYVAIALTARNGTTKKLHLTTPSDRQHWGYHSDRAGVREWADENGLAVVGANFIFAKNHKQ